MHKFWLPSLVLYQTDELWLSIDYDNNYIMWEIVTLVLDFWENTLAHISPWYPNITGCWNSFLRWKKISTFMTLQTVDIMVMQRARVSTAKGLINFHWLTWYPCQMVLLPVFDFYAGPSARGRQLYCRACNFKNMSALLAGNIYTCYVERNSLPLLMDTGTTRSYSKDKH